MSKMKLLILMVMLILITVPISFAADNNTEYVSIEEIESVENSDIGYETLSENNDAIYVSTDGNDTYDGSSQNHVASISKGIELATKDTNTAHKLIINEGTYYEYGLNINSNLEIIGLGNVIIDAKENYNDRILTIETTDEVKITGITFQNGKYMDGGAIQINKAKVSINNCKFINNTSDNCGALYWNGNDGTLTNSYFSGNKGRKNSAAICWGGVSEESVENFGDNGLIINITLENNDNGNSQTGSCMGLSITSNNVKVLNSTFINNKGNFETIGGSLFLGGKNIIIDNCLFENNTMDQGSAIQCEGDNATIKNCRFINNTVETVASGSGGAIYLQSTSASIINNTFKNNGGDECHDGGAISIYYIADDTSAIINILNNKFIDNSAKYGGNIFINGGAEDYSEFKYIIINNNTFDGGDAGTAAGIYVMYVTIEEDENISTVMISNNKFKNLVANYVSCIFIDSASVLLENNTITNCISKDGNNHIYNNEGYISGELHILVNNNNTIELLFGRHVLINATLTDNMGNVISGGNLTLIVEGQYISEDGYIAETGTISIDFYSTEYGFFTISADYLNGDKPIVKTSRVISVPYYIHIDFNESEGFATNEISIPVTVSIEVAKTFTDGVELDEYYLDNENITITFNNEKFNVLVINGKANINLKLPKNAGKYDLTVTYDVEGLTKEIIVKDNHVVLTPKTLDIIPKSDNFILKLTDFNGNPLFNENLTLIFNNTKTTLKTNEKGEVSFPLKLNEGEYDISINYTSNKFSSQEFKYTLNVAYTNVIITANDVTMNYKDGSSYIVRLTDDKLNPIANQILTVKISGKNYEIKTDSNGIATLLIELNPNNYAVNVIYSGNNKYNSKSITGKIIVKSVGKLTSKSLTAYYTAKTTYKVRLYDAKGKVVSGKVVKITVNGKTHSIKTDKNGYASLKINLKPNTYSITSTYGVLKVSNKIVIKPLLTAKDITKKKAKKIKFSAKLVNNKGKVVKNKKITFKIKGKKYTAKTNKKGVATVSLKNLKVGKYTITTKYEKSTIKNTIKIKK